MHPRWRGCKVACKGDLFFSTPPKRVTSPAWGPPLPCKQALRLSKEQPFICITLFLYISLPSLHDYDVKLPHFTFCRGRECKTLAFCFAELRYSLSEFNSWKISQHFTKWTRWNKRDQVRSSANSLFKLPSTHLSLLRVSILNVNVYARAFLSTFQRVLVNTKLWRNIERDLKQKIYIHSVMYVVYKRPRLFPAPLLTVVRISQRHILTSGLGNHFLFPFGSE